MYPGTCREGLVPGRTVRAYRVRVPSEPVDFDDGIQGPVTQCLTSAVGDFVVKRADGPFAYQLAVVVDDAAAGVTQVARGADLLSSTPRQIHLQRQLGLPVPSYYHLPLVTGPGGEKLSKRNHSVSLAEGRDLRREGGTLLWGALMHLGQNPPTAMKRALPAEVLAWALAHFDATRVPRRPSSFPEV